MKDLTMKKDDVSCKEVMSHICDSLGEELNSPKCQAIRSHMESCNNCQNYFNSVETTIDFYKNYNVQVSDDTHNRLLDFLDLKD